MNIVKLIPALLVVIACVSCTQETEISPGSADEFVAVYEANLEKFETACKLKFWQYRDEPTADSLYIFLKALNGFLADPGVTDKIDHYRMSTKDDVISRKMDLINARSMLEQIETEPDVAALKDSFRLILHAADKAGKNNEYIYDIASALLRGEYLTEQNISDKYGDMLLSLIRKRNIAAKRHGYNSYYSLALKTENIEPAFVDSLCRQLLSKTDTVFRSGLSRLASPGERNPGLYTFHKDVRESVGVNLDQSAQNRIVRDACNSIGFDIDKMPIYYFFADSGITGPMEVFPIHVPDDIRVAAATFPSLGSLEGLLECSGLALYAASIDQKDYLFLQPSSIVWQEAIRHIFASLIFEPAFLTNHLSVTEQYLETWRRMHDHYMLIKLRYAIFYALLEKELYTGSIPDVEKFYSELFDRVFFNSPPADTKAGLIALFDDQYPIAAHNNLLGLLVAGQVYHHMKATNGEIVGNPATRHYLVQNCFRYGARYDWRELLKWATGEDLKYEYYFDFSD